MLYLEQRLGTKDQFEDMLRAYILKFRQQSITTDEWIQFLNEYFNDKKDVLEKVDFNGWLNKPVSLSIFVGNKKIERQEKILFYNPPKRTIFDTTSFECLGRPTD